MTIQSVRRATDITSLFSMSQPALGITQIAKALELNKATVWGIVTTLEQEGFLQQDPETQKYSLGPKLFELGMAFVSNLEINAKASRPVHNLASRTGMNARIGIWSGKSVLVTSMALPKAEDSLSPQIGPRVPAYCSALGKVLLAFMEREALEEYLAGVELMRHTATTIVSVEALRADLEQTRERGYSITREEMIPGVIAMGAPVFGKERRLVAAISLSGPPKLVAGRKLEEAATELMNTAAQISQEMGYYSALAHG
jgi:DNA-binding IclR family transcriptional regulator